MDRWLALLCVMLFALRMTQWAMTSAGRWWLAGMMGKDVGKHSPLPPALLLLHPMLVVLAPHLSFLKRISSGNRLDELIVAAGFEGALTREELIALQCLCALGGAGIACLAGGLSLAAMALGGSGGWIIGRWVFIGIARQRRRQMQRTLPTMFDWLALSVEAGLEVMMALQRIAELGRLGPLGRELTRLVGEVRLGVPRALALKRLAARVQLPALTSFVATLAQADRFGSPIAPLIRAHAERLRQERFLAAEKAGAAASQKILLPLILLIMPATFLVVFGPLAIRYFAGGWEGLLG